MTRVTRTDIQLNAQMKAPDKCRRPASKATGGALQERPFHGGTSLKRSVYDETLRTTKQKMDSWTQSNTT